MSDWLVGRFEPGDIEWSKVEEIAAWIRSLGLDPTHMALRAAVVQVKDGFELHLARQVLNERGQPYLNAALDEVATESVIVPVEKDSWPQWLAGMRCGRKSARIELRADGSPLGDWIIAMLRKQLRDNGEPGADLVEVS